MRTFTYVSLLFSDTHIFSLKTNDNKYMVHDKAVIANSINYEIHDMEIKPLRDLIKNQFAHNTSQQSIDQKAMEPEQYKQLQDDLKRRQEDHLRNIRKNKEPFYIPCLHDSCPNCIGTGLKSDGSICVHMIYCSCPKCSPTSLIQHKNQV